MFPKQKLRVDKTICDALNSCTTAYNAWLISGNMNKNKPTADGLCRLVREMKRHYRRKLESQF